jgi:hypothetical protein
MEICIHIRKMWQILKFSMKNDFSHAFAQSCKSSPNKQFLLEKNGLNSPSIQ